MPTMQFEFTETEVRQLSEFARLHNQKTEDYAITCFRQWLADHRKRVMQAAQTVVTENAELYRRLA
jgi:hypothetical protein